MTLQLVGADTESYPDGSMLSLSASTSRGSGFTMAAGVCIPMESLEAAFHNALWDMPVLIRAGYPLPAICHDTYLMLKLLQADSLGLKANARRELGMVMRDYMDVVGPYQKELSVAYLHRAWKVAKELPVPEPQLIRQALPDGGGITTKLYKPTPLSRVGKPKRKADPAPDTGKIARLLKDIEDGKLDKEGNPPDALKRWKEWGEGGDGQTEAVEAVIGPHPVASLADVPDPERMVYECQDSDAGLRLFHVLKPRLQSAGLWDAYLLDIASFPMVAEMEANGIMVDRPRLLRLIDRLEVRLADVETDCWEMAGYPFNPQSSDQVAHLLYRKMGLKPRRFTEGGSEGTQDDDILPYRLEYPIVSRIIEYRRLLKLQTTYALPYERLSRADGRVRCRYGLSQTIRFQGREPNLSAIPAHMGVVPVPEAAELHNCFIPSPGMVFLAWDLSQIEMRVVAHLSHDPEMCRCFHADEDIHTKTAMDVFGLTSAEVLADEDRYRYPMKRTGFGIVYGLTGSGLFRQMEYEMPGHWTEQQCFQFIEDYLSARPGIRQYMTDTIALGRRTGEVRDLVGHRLLCPALRSPNEKMKMDEERRVINFPVQCIPGDTRIRTRQGYVPIDQYQDGTEVWTGTAWAPAVRREMGTASIVCIHLSDGSDVRCAADHDVLTLRTARPDWVSASYLRPGDFLPDGMTISDGGEQYADPEFWYWVGRYYGDGHFFLGKTATDKSNRRNVMWAFGRQEPDDIQRCAAFLERIGANPTVETRLNKRNGYTSYAVHGRRKLVDMFIELGIKGRQKAGYKRIADRCFTQDATRRLSFLEGYYAADGTHRKQYPYGRAAVCITSISKGLLADAATMYRSLGMGTDLLGPYGGVSQTAFYRLFLRPNYTDAPDKKTLVRMPGRWVSSVKELGVVEPVYTLSVDHDDHSYDAEGVISKNCGAVSLVKAGMAQVYQALQPLSSTGSLRWLLQEHDAIKCEVEEGWADVVKPWVKELLEGAMELRVPVKASSQMGMTLGELH